MNNKLLKIVNSLLFIAFLTVAISIALYTLPGKLNGSETIYDIHSYAGIAFIILAVLHIILNRKWIMSQIFGVKRR